MSHCLCRLEHSRNTTILPDCICELFEVELEDRNNSFIVELMMHLKTQGPSCNVHWSVTLSDDDVYSVMFNKQMKNDYLRLLKQ